MSSQTYKSYTAMNCEHQGIVPVTVKQLAESYQSDGGVVINGLSVTKLTLVGLVYDKDNSRSEYIKFILNDGTGRIVCKRWLIGRFDAKEMESVRNGIYVRVIGEYKTVHGATDFVVFSVRPIKDLKEVRFHSVECKHFCSQNSESQLGQQVPNVTQSVSTTFQGGLAISQATPLKQVVPSQNLEDMILNYLKQPACTVKQHGMHIDKIGQQLKIPKNRLKDVIESLEGDGLIYSTIDNYHFKHIEF